MGARQAGYDLIVVGGGSAGCVLAARASEDPARRVLLIEAGPDPQPVPDIVADPRRQQELIRDPSLARRYPVRRADGSEYVLVSGRLMGGGSAVNNMAVVRPMARDFADWQRFGGAAWSYERLLPLMCAIEDDEDFAASPIHGSGGPLHLHRDFRLGDPLDPPGAALVAAARAMGLPDCPDLNAAAPMGICASPYNIVDGRRQSVADAYLGAARERANLRIMAGTRVARLWLDDGVTRGVELADREATRVPADEVVLAAGVFHSPQLLMLSGIGPAAELQRAGLRVAHELPGVGANYQDHAVAYCHFTATDALHRGDRIPKLRFLIASDERLAGPDLHVIVHGPAWSPGTGGAQLTISVRLLDHRSSGTVTLASANPSELPLVEPALLEHPADVQAMVDGIGFVDRLTSDPSVAAFYGPMRIPASRDGWRDHLLATHVSYHHGVGTCRLGGDDDPAAVVDGQLRVRGIQRLRVADASVLPTIPHANTNLAAILVGEVAARAIAG